MPAFMSLNFYLTIKCKILVQKVCRISRINYLVLLLPFVMGGQIWKTALLKVETGQPVIYLVGL